MNNPPQVGKERGRGEAMKGREEKGRKRREEKRRNGREGKRREGGEGGVVK